MNSIVSRLCTDSRGAYHQRGKTDANLYQDLRYSEEQLRAKYFGSREKAFMVYAWMFFVNLKVVHKVR